MCGYAAESAATTLKLLLNILEFWNFIPFYDKNKPFDLNHYNYDDSLFKLRTIHVTNSPGAHAYCWFKPNACEA